MLYFAAGRQAGSSPVFQCSRGADREVVDHA